MSNAIAAEYQSQPWIMEPAALKAFAERIGGLPQGASLFAIEVAAKPKQLTVAGGVAKIAIAGYLLDTVPGWLRAWGIKATGYDEIVEQVNEAAERSDVTAIELIVDSPGGMVGGVISPADAIYAARGAKPVSAVIKRLGASGAYWLASQAETIVANDANTGVGAIGVFTWYVDYTKFEDRIGVKYIVVRSGEHKGMGIDTITDTQIAAVQQYIDATADNFIGAVARGRAADIKSIGELATGQLWIAGAARELGLIDAVNESPASAEGGGLESNNATETASDIQGDIVMDKETTEQAIGAEQLETARRNAQSDERMRISQLKTEFADDPGFALQAATEGWTLDEAKAKYCDVLRERLKTSDAERGGGAEAIATEGTDDAGSGDFLAEARQLAKDEGISMTAAMKKIRRRSPGLHESFKGRCRTQGKAMYADAV